MSYLVSLAIFLMKQRQKKIIPTTNLRLKHRTRYILRTLLRKSCFLGVSNL
jgi:hypothetical protein